MTMFFRSLFFNNFSKKHFKVRFFKIDPTSVKPYQKFFIV